MSQQIRYRRL
ncbi:hypothetical protein H4Q32_012446 [Labeo rohita]|uniref:Uncharacterized protein n=1 Tax=Labeo rohita TaxID=84645 RepID=A0ABQ8MNN7_LABRO|nr:hypothetical protein H4Q32_012446 [Labeo rohita]